MPELNLGGYVGCMLGREENWRKALGREVTSRGVGTTNGSVFMGGKWVQRWPGDPFQDSLLCRDWGAIRGFKQGIEKICISNSSLWRQPEGWI